MIIGYTVIFQVNEMKKKKYPQPHTLAKKFGLPENDHYIQQSHNALKRGETYQTDEKLRHLHYEQRRGKNK